MCCWLEYIEFGVSIMSRVEQIKTSSLYKILLKYYSGHGLDRAMVCAEIESYLLYQKDFQHEFKLTCKT